jgi:hypothetical protein
MLEVAMAVSKATAMYTAIRLSFDWMKRDYK